MATIVKISHEPAEAAYEVVALDEDGAIMSATYDYGDASKSGRTKHQAKQEAENFAKEFVNGWNLEVEILTNYP